MLKSHEGEPIKGVAFAAMPSTPAQRTAETISDPTGADGRTTIRLSSVPAGPRVFRVIPGIDFHRERTLLGVPLDPDLARWHFREAYTLRLPDPPADRVELTIRATPATSLRGALRFSNAAERTTTDDFLVFTSTNPGDYNRNTTDEEAFFIPRLSATEPGTLAFFVPEARETPLMTLDGSALDRPEHDAGEFEFSAPEATVPLAFTYGPASMFDIEGVHMHDAVYYWMFASWIAEDGSFAYVFQTSDQQGAVVHWSAEGETRVAPGRYFVVPGNAAYGDAITAGVLGKIARGEQGRLRETGVPRVEVPDGHEGAFEFQLDPIGIVADFVDGLIQAGDP